MTYGRVSLTGVVRDGQQRVSDGGLPGAREVCAEPRVGRRRRGAGPRLLHAHQVVHVRRAHLEAVHHVCTYTSQTLRSCNCNVVRTILITISYHNE